jgi:hypothetical protein
MLLLIDSYREDISSVADQVRLPGSYKARLVAEFPNSSQEQEYDDHDIIHEKGFDIPRHKGRPALKEDKKHIACQATPCNPLATNLPWEDVGGYALFCQRLP